LCRIPASTGLAADWIKPGLGAAESVKVSETVATPNLTTVPEPTTLTSEQRLGILREVSLSAETPATSAPASDADNVSEIPFFGKGLPEVATDFLRKGGKPMGNAEIATAMVEAGFPFTQKDHEVAVEGALKRRATSEADVTRVAPGTWGMVAWCNCSPRHRDCYAI